MLIAAAYQPASVVHILYITLSANTAVGIVGESCAVVTSEAVSTVVGVAMVDVLRLAL